jgi:protein-S-isoprenylcysteine O-methyltransferase Ste14
MTLDTDTTLNFNRIHLSAFVAGGCYLTAFVIDALVKPADVQHLLADSAAAFVFLIPLAVFMVTVIASQHYMGVSLSTAHGPTPDSLCMSGPFRYSRNPIYAAFILPLAAHSYYSIVAALLSIALYMLITTRVVIRPEERMLQRTFGMTYRQYQQTTPRWFIF